METQQQTPVETQAPTPDTMSHDDYRAYREGRQPAAKEPAAAAETTEQSEAPAEEVEAKTEPDSETGDEEQQEGTSPKKKGGFQKRIDKLTRENAELARQLEDAKKGTPSAKPEEKPAAEAQPEGAKSKPKQEDFKTYDEFIEALTDWKQDQREMQREAKAREEQTKADQKAAAEKWQKQLTDARAKHADFDKVALSDAPISRAVHDAIIGSELGTEIAYYLGQNPAERERINGLGRVAAMIELGKITAKLEAQSEPAEKKPAVSAAPAPIKPVGTKSATPAKSLEDMSADEYRKARESGRGR